MKELEIKENNNYRNRAKLEETHVINTANDATKEIEHEKENI